MISQFNGKFRFTATLSSTILLASLHFCTAHISFKSSSKHTKLGGCLLFTVPPSSIRFFSSIVGYFEPVVQCNVYTKIMFQLTQFPMDSFRILYLVICSACLLEYWILMNSH